jgi:hypothetical protein
VEGTEDQDKTREGSVGRDRLEPVIVQAEQAHLGLGGSENQVSELFNLQASLERKLKLGTFDDNVGEIYYAETIWRINCMFQTMATLAKHTR